MRQERTHLQHEVDILNQKLNQKLFALKDEMKGMFDDHKLDIKEGKSTGESAVCKLHSLSVIF